MLLLYLRWGIVWTTHLKWTAAVVQSIEHLNWCSRWWVRIFACDFDSFVSWPYFPMQPLIEGVQVRSHHVYVTKTTGLRYHFVLSSCNGGSWLIQHIMQIDQIKYLLSQQSPVSLWPFVTSACFLQTGWNCPSLGQTSVWPMSSWRPKQSCGMQVKQSHRRGTLITVTFKWHFMQDRIILICILCFVIIVICIWYQTTISHWQASGEVIDDLYWSLDN